MEPIQKVNLNDRYIVLKQTDFVREYTYSYLLGAHPNIIDTYEGMYQTISDDAFFFVQEVYPRTNLQKLIEHKRSGLQEDIAKLILLRILDALEYIHQKQFVHGNLKAENVLIFGVDTYTTVKIADFSHTKKFDALTKRTQEIHSYMAPELCEIIANEVITVNLSLDMWSLGILFFLCFKGMFPWDKAISICKPYREWEAWIKLKSHYMPKSFTSFTEKAMKVIRKCLHPKPKERGTIHEIRRYIEKEPLVKAAKIMGRSQSYHGQRSHSVARGEHISRRDQIKMEDKREKVHEKRKSSSFKRWLNSAMNTMTEFSNQVVSAHDH